MIKYFQDLGVVRLSPKGALAAEKKGILPAAAVARNRHSRKCMLIAISDHLREVGAAITIPQLAVSSGVAAAEFRGNVNLLVAMGYLKWEVPDKRLSINPKVYTVNTAAAHK
jgi:hypothetical protein